MFQALSAALFAASLAAAVTGEPALYAGPNSDIGRELCAQVHLDAQSDEWEYDPYTGDCYQTDSYGTEVYNVGDFAPEDYGYGADGARTAPEDYDPYGDEEGVEESAETITLPEVVIVAKTRPKAAQGPQKGCLRTTLEQGSGDVLRCG